MAEKYCRNKILKNKIPKKTYSVRKELKYYALQIDAKCCYCGTRFDIDILPTVDHIIPKINGGTTEISNLIVCCARCNAVKKGSLSLEEFIEKRPHVAKHLRRYLNKFGRLIINNKKYINGIAWIRKYLK